MRERLVLELEVCDDLLDDGVIAVLGLHDGERLGAVGDQAEVPPVRKQLGLRAEQRVRLTISLRSPYVVSAICASPPSG